MRRGISGDELRAMRAVRRISQTELAAEMGTAQSYVSQIELKAHVKTVTAERYASAIERIVARDEQAS